MKNFCRYEGLKIIMNEQWKNISLVVTKGSNKYKLLQ